MSSYEICLLGDISSTDRSALSNTLEKLLESFDLRLDREVVLRSGENFAGRDIRAATAAAYFGGDIQADKDMARQILEASLPIIPTVTEKGKFSEQIPDFLHRANGFVRKENDPKMMSLAIALLGCVGLLRRQRRVFVSYRRVESRNAAVQLHDLLSGRGFDVFLDTHDIRPGESFQDELWHRLCDSDVMVMLDTRTYFESKWTRQEFARARAKEIHILRVVWPEHSPNKQTDFAETIYLGQEDLHAADGPIAANRSEQIVLAVESLRSRSIASRYMSITGKLRVEVNKIGGEVGGVGAHRAISLTLPEKLKLWAYPVVGIPTAELLNDVADKARLAQQGGVPVLIYDHIGIRHQWLQHLEWLDDNISSVRAVKVSEAAWEFADWEVQ